MEQQPPVTEESPGQLPLFGHQRQRATGDEPPSTARRLSDATADYLVLLGSIRRSVHSIRAARLDLDGLARHLGDPPLAAVTADHLRGFVARLNVQDGLAPGSVTRKVASIKGLFRHATAQGWLARDPALPLVYPR